MGAILEKSFSFSETLAFTRYRHQLALGRLVVVDRLEREVTDLGRLRIDAVRAQNLPHLLGRFGGAIVGFARSRFLRGDVELHESGIRIGFEFAVGADENGVGLGGDGGSILGESRLGEQKREGQCESGFHGVSLLNMISWGRIRVVQLSRVCLVSASV